MNICEKIKNDRHIIVYHATSELQENLKRGYLGGDRKIYFSLSTHNLIDTLKEGKFWYDPVAKKTIKKTDYGIFKIKDFPIDKLYLDEEIWLARAADEIIYDWSPASQEFTLRVIDSEYTETPIPLREAYHVCKELGEDKFLHYCLGWVFFPKGRKIRISEENIIPYNAPQKGEPKRR